MVDTLHPQIRHQGIDRAGNEAVPPDVGHETVLPGDEIVERLDPVIIRIVQVRHRLRDQVGDVLVGKDEHTDQQETDYNLSGQTPAGGADGQRRQNGHHQRRKQERPVLDQENGQEQETDQQHIVYADLVPAHVVQGIDKGQDQILRPLHIVHEIPFPDEILFRIRNDESRIDEGDIEHEDEIDDGERIQSTPDFQMRRPDGQQDDQGEIAEEIPVNDERIIQMLAVIQIGRDKGNQGAYQDPHQRLHLLGDAETDLDAHIPDIDDHQQQQIGEEKAFVPEQPVEGDHVEERGREQHQQKQFDADVQPIPVFRN